MEIPLGSKVRCKLTGFVGTAVAKTEFINGCVQYTVMPKCDKEGKIVDEISIDDQSLEILPVKKKKIQKDNTGGPMRKGPQRRNF